jgi:hypothetical protein
MIELINHAKYLVPWGTDKINQELSKGRFLCVWCHRLETAGENNYLKETRIEVVSKEKWEPLDENPKVCRGILCNGALRNSLYFYTRKRNGNVCGNCKRCISLQRTRNRAELKNNVDAIKLSIGKCSECFIPVSDETVCCFDFDHLERQDKLCDISTMISKLKSFSSIKEEIAKCRLLCCKCHRIHTSVQMNYTKIYVPPKLICFICKLDVSNCDRTCTV